MKMSSQTSRAGFLSLSPAARLPGVWHDGSSEVSCAWVVPLLDSSVYYEAYACVMAFPSALLQAGFPLPSSTHLNGPYFTLVPLKSPTLMFIENSSRTYAGDRLDSGNA